MANDIGKIALYGAGAYILGDVALNGAFGAQIQSAVAQLAKTLGIRVSIGGPGAPPAPGAGPITPAQIQAWSNGIGLPNWIGTMYVAANGVLPPSIAALQQWGGTAGYWNSVTGVWTPPVTYSGG